MLLFAKLNLQCICIYMQDIYMCIYVSCMKRRLNDELLANEREVIKVKNANELPTSVKV